MLIRDSVVIKKQGYYDKKRTISIPDKIDISYQLTPLPKYAYINIVRDDLVGPEEVIIDGELSTIMAWIDLIHKSP